MYRAQYKKSSPYGAWTTIGTYSSEAGAISSALSYKNKGMLVVRVVDKKGMVVYSS